VKYVLFYESPVDLDMAAVREHFADHRATWARYQEDGRLLLIGPFADPRDGAMAVFTTKDAAEEFATSDPFVRNGLVARWHVQEWNEALLDPQ
jgi:uncharacterized protein YciI